MKSASGTTCERSLALGAIPRCNELNVAEALAPTPISGAAAYRSVQAEPGEVKFSITANGDVVIKPVAPKLSALRASFEQARGSADAQEFKGMGTDEFMKFIRG